MPKAFIAPVLSRALTEFKNTVKQLKKSPDGEDERLVVFCEDRLSLVAERAVCEAVGGTFSVSVYTLSRFLSGEAGKADNVLSSRGSAMVMRKIIDRNADKLSLFRRLSTAGAAQEVYDTVALLYSCKISAQDIGVVDGGGELLKRKLHDISLLYAEYESFLKESGAVDRNAYLRRLPQVICASQKIRGAKVLFLGFNAFTSSVKDCVRACMQTADDVYGVFIGDRQGAHLYQNEASADFLGVAQELKLPVEVIYLPSGLTAEAELLRKNIFEPERLKNAVAMDICRDESGETDNAVSITEAADEREECRFIAAHIKKCVRKEGIKHHRISVMLSNLERYQPVLERTFAEYEIPFYVDRRYPLLTHPLCEFILKFLDCAANGMRRQSVLAVINSCFFARTAGDAPLYSRGDKHLFTNYLLRAAAGRGGIKRPLDEAIVKEICGADGARAAELIRGDFLCGAAFFPAAADGADFCKAVKSLLDYFNAENTLAEAADDSAFAPYPSVAATFERVYPLVTQVLDEAAALTGGERLAVREFARILKSGFAAAEVSLIPPKQNAVFVSDISQTANAGSEIVFAAGLTDAIPVASQDTSLLTDSELNSLDKLKSVSPKIAQVNKRVKELTALNLCSFSKRLYLLYPVKSGGEDCAKSEVIAYASALFNLHGMPLLPVSARHIAGLKCNLPYYCCKKAPALRLVATRGGDVADYSAAYLVLTEAAALPEYDANFKSALKIICGGQGDGDKSVASAPRLNAFGVSPTALETYFSCPYKWFMQQGLRLQERKEGEFRPLDSGVFIHAVLEEVAQSVNGLGSEKECAELTERTATQKLALPAFAPLARGDRGEYTARALVEETVRISLGAYRQLKNSSFKVSAVERRCAVALSGGVTVGGRIDRVDESDGLVRVIDYKTGGADSSASAYYMGLKLQLPLYLHAASQGKRPVGAYYFMANAEYSSLPDGDFCLKGFMDGDADVVRRSDALVEEKKRSAYVDAYLNGKQLEGTLPSEEFADFVEYSLLVADGGVREMNGGRVTPSPAEGTCDYCPFAGCCGYDRESKGERRRKAVDCKKIAAIARAAKIVKEGE